jgi:hypothetical protein
MPLIVFARERSAAGGVGKLQVQAALRSLESSMSLPSLESYGHAREIKRDRPHDSRASGQAGLSGIRAGNRMAADARTPFCGHRDATLDAIRRSIAWLQKG